VFFFEHEFEQTRRFLVLVDIAESQDVAVYDETMPIVTMRSSRHKFVVCQLDEIECVIGLVRCSNNENKFKVISQHIQRSSLRRTIGTSTRNL
jgi:uncharacterized protein involved in tellurium resistance